MKLKWNEEANQAFNALKERFKTAPILKHLDPDLPFVVEVDASVDASDFGKGALPTSRPTWQTIPMRILFQEVNRSREEL